MRYVQPPTYLEAIGEAYPDVEVTSFGDGSDYDTIQVVTGSLPPKDELDALIASKTRDRMWKIIQVERDRRRTSGVKVGAKWFHSDDTSRIQQLGLLLLGNNMPATLMWKSMDGSFVQMTPALANQIFMSIVISDQTIFGAAEQHRAQMNASATPETYNFLTTAPFWPKVYGE